MTKNVYRISNNAYETNKKQNIIDAWKISLKYSKILMDHSNNDDYLSELQREGLNFKNKNYMQVWDTMINTQKRNPKRDIKAGAIKLLHQTNVQRCDRFNR